MNAQANLQQVQALSVLQEIKRRAIARSAAAYERVEEARDVRDDQAFQTLRGMAGSD